MKYRTVGRSGLHVSTVGLGCAFAPEVAVEEIVSVVNAALDEGVTHFDTADVYGSSEAALGFALAQRRDEVTIATKFGFPLATGPMRSGGSRKYVMAACEASLRRLGTDHVDLYYQHMPDPLVPIEETVSALSTLVEQGKVLYAGVSNYYAWQMSDAVHAAREFPSVEIVAQQVGWNLIDRSVEREIVPACQRHGVGLIPFHPLASGLLTGKYQRGSDPADGTRFSRKMIADVYLSDRNLDLVQKVAAWAAEHDRTLVDTALGWLLAHDVVPCVIVGARNPEQVHTNVTAAARELSAEERDSLERVIAEFAPPPDSWQQRLTSFDQARGLTS